MYYTLVLNLLLFWFSDVHHQHGKSQRNKACKTCSVFGPNVLGFPYWNQQSSRVSKSLVRCNSRIYNWNIYSSVFGKCVFVTLFFEKYRYISLYLLTHVGRLDFSNVHEVFLFCLIISFLRYIYVHSEMSNPKKKWSDCLFWFPYKPDCRGSSTNLFYIKPHIKQVHIS